MHRVASSPAVRHLAQATQKRKVFVNRALNARRPRTQQPAKHSTFVPPLSPPAAPSAASSSAQHAASSAEPLTWEQVQSVVIASAVPMVGFGFMDNVVMIQAGSYIDSTLGVQFGLATMTAAAAGQVFSDVSGVLFGGSVERLLSPWIKPPSLTAAQRQLPAVARLRLAGAVGGVIVGCVLGAFSLFFVWHDEDEAEKLAQFAESLRQLRAVTRDLLSEMDEASSIATCTIHVANASSSAVPSDDQSKVCLQKLDPSISSKQHGLAGDGSSMYVPVRSSDDKVVAVLQFDSSSASGFSNDDQQTVERMSRHVAIVLKRMVLQ